MKILPPEFPYNVVKDSDTIQIYERVLVSRLNKAAKAETNAPGLTF